MSVEDSRVVDLVGIDPATGHVVLTISDHLSWEADEHLSLLQDKLNAYLRFIESRELFDEYPDARDRAPQISVVFNYPPDERGLRFLEAVAETIEKAGIGFRYETMPR